MSKVNFNRTKKGHKSFESAWNGVANYQQKNYPNALPKTNEPYKYASMLSSLIREFLVEKGIEHKQNNSMASSSFNANLIQDNWKEFKEFLSKK